MKLGFAITQHCNLRCPHCIRDDVTRVLNLPVEVIRSVCDQALELFGRMTVSLTGGEPLLHPEFGGIVSHFAVRELPYRLVTNGWHIRRALPLLAGYPPEFVRLSLSGATEGTHDAIRGRGSFQRVVQAALLLTGRRIPSSLSLVVDRTSRAQLRVAAELADTLGVIELQYILPQPVPGSVAGGTDVPLSDWGDVRDDVWELAQQFEQRFRIDLAYGYPFAGAETVCGSKRLERIYIDAHGRLCTCCLLSEYGTNEADVVADLTRITLAQAWPEYTRRMASLESAGARTGDAQDPLDAFPCLRCARSCGKLVWTGQLYRSPAPGGLTAAEPASLVQLRAGREAAAV
jgi:MoaA/NifB/PqqE/SkfB family radical SAM enzyme